MVNAALGLRTTLCGYNGGCIDIEIFRKISIDIDRNIRIPHRNSTSLIRPNTCCHLKNLCKLDFRPEFGLRTKSGIFFEVIEGVVHVCCHCLEDILSSLGHRDY